MKKSKYFRFNYDSIIQQQESKKKYIIKKLFKLNNLARTWGTNNTAV